MKIKLTKTLSFEPSKDSVMLYIIFLLWQTLIFLLFHNTLMFISIIITWNLIFIWVNTTYYPYGVKYEDKN